MERKRLTASAAFLGYRISPVYDRSINKSKTNCNEILNALLFLAF